MKFRMYIYAGLFAGAFTVPNLRADTPLTTSHPSYDLFNMRPDNFNLRVGGMDWLSDGRLAVSDWGADMQVIGKVFILTGMNGTDRTKVQYKEFASALKEPLGLKVVNDTIYVLCKDGLYMLPDANKDGVADEKRKVVGGWSYPPKPEGGERWHLFNFGLLFKDGFFYGTLGSEYPPSSTQGKDRGSLVKMNPKAGTFEVMTGGLRTPNGIGFGPEGEIFGSDNQGHWLPSNKLNNFRKGRNYGMHNDPTHPYDVSKVPPSPPAVWIDHGNVGLSPSEPAYVTKGVYAGQFLIGDVSYGGIQRIFLEKVNNEWQGGVFRFAGGFEAGTNRLTWGPDGALYVGQIGNGGTNWGWRDKYYGLTKLVFNNKPTFEMLAARSRRNGMELEFTEALADSATNVSKYRVQTWVNIPAEGYGAGNHMNTRTLIPKSIRLSDDKKKVFLELDGLTPTWVLGIRASVTSATGKTPWVNEVWYTLNNISTSNAFDAVVGVDPRLRSPEFLASDLRLRADHGDWVVQVPFHGAYQVTLRDWRGARLQEQSGANPSEKRFQLGNLPRGAYLVEVRIGAKRFALPAHRL